jgi:hypothetical protein
LKKELQHTLRFFEHMKFIVRTYFEISQDFQSILDYQDDEIHINYIRDIFKNAPLHDNFTIEQRYLYSLVALVEPILSAYRTRNRIRRLQPRIKIINASFALEESVKRLSMEAYHFKERVRMFSESTNSLVEQSGASITGFNNSIGRIIRTYTQNNLRLIKFRNFVVHGPKGRIDEFEYLRRLELACIFLHDDLWLEYKNEFDSARSEWTALARELVGSMETAIAAIQLANEHLVSNNYARPASSERSSGNESQVRPR